MEQERDIFEDYVVFVSCDGERFHLTKDQCAKCMNIGAMLTKLDLCNDTPIQLPLVTIEEVKLVKTWFSESILPENPESIPSIEGFRFSFD